MKVDPKQLKKLFLDGSGMAGDRFMKRLISSDQFPLPGGPPTQVRVTDLDEWQRKHAEAGIVKGSEAGVAKACSAALRLRDAGIPATACVGDSRDHPRSSYRNGLTVSATDAHEVKNDSVLKSQQAGSPAIAMGLGPGEATVEFYSPSPGSAGYCCCHGRDPSFYRRIPCSLLRRRVSTTKLVCDSRPVDLAAKLAVDVAVEYLRTGEFNGNRGAYIRQAVEVEWYDFAIDPNCEGPHHDPAFKPTGSNVVTLSADPDGLTVREILQLAGNDVCYADRDLAWVWECNRCGRTEHARVHTVHPPAECRACGVAMRPAVERVSGLTADQLVEFHGGRDLTLAEMGLAAERIIRLVEAATGNIVWVHLLGEEER